MKKAVIFTVLFAIFYTVINFSGIGVTGLLKITDGANILDFEFGYSEEEAYDMLTALGEEGREFYLTKIIPLDFPFPVTYMLFYAGWIALLLKHITQSKRFKYLLLIPVLAALSDWIENIGIIAMLRSYPDLPPWAAATASFAGMIKFSLTALSIAVIIVLLFVFIYKKSKQRSKQNGA
ncbi:MAG: hypothetical protein FWE74_06455 [Oscillospiraceae bacterium]|nr:hypothetical protein [Oscillospiraceae bacterium]